jgi:hypothetical protein
MLWAQFAIAALIIIGVGYKLSHYGDQIAARTGISRTFLGIILFSTVTSLARKMPKRVKKRLAKYIKAAIRNKTASPTEGTFWQKEETAYGSQGVIRQTS